MTYEVFDGQPMGGVYEDGEVFTLADQAELDAFAKKYANADIAIMKDRTRSLKNKLMSTDKNARALVIRDWLADNPIPSESEIEALMRLRDKAYHAKTASMNPDRYDTLECSKRDGFMSDEEAQRHVRIEQNRAKRDSFNLANVMFFEIAAREKIISNYPESIMSDGEKAKIAESFDEFDRWEKTKAAFRERYQACKSMRERAELERMFPDLAKTVM